MTSPSDPIVRWATDAIGAGARVVSVQQLRADNGPWLVRVDKGGSAVEAVLKTGPPDIRADLATEAAALGLAEKHGVPAPRLLALDLAGSCGAPALLMTALPGSSQVPVRPTRERLHAVGAAAASLHRIALAPGPALPLRSRHMPWVDFASERRRAPQGEVEAASTSLLLAADERLREVQLPEADTVFVHGDLWQGNTMWSKGRLIGVIDWEAAGAGHFGVDLGCLRWDAAILFGTDKTSDEITMGWEQGAGRKAERLAYWDVVAALNTPEELGGFLPAIHAAGRVDLDARTLTARRDAFLRGALERLES